MKRTKSIIISVIVFIIAIALGLFIYYKAFHDVNKLSIKEKEWIENNKQALINIHIPNNLNIFGFNGAGVFFDFIEDLEKEQEGITFNKITSDASAVPSELGFVVNKDITSNDLLFYTDYFVVVGKSNEHIASFDKLKGNKVGVLAETLTRVSDIYSTEMQYSNYEDKTKLIEALKTDEVKYVIIPKTEYLDLILSNNFKIVYHLSDLTINYYLKFGFDEELNSIIKKHYNRWYEEDYKETYYDYSYNLYLDKLGLSQAETDMLTNKNYIYGFVLGTPYHMLSSSNYGGIASVYLTEFSNFSGVEFTYNKYKTTDKLVSDFNNQKIDLMFVDTSINLNHHSIYTNLNNKYYIISPLSDTNFIASVKELKNKKVTTLENSKISAYLNTIPEVGLNTVKNEAALVKASKKGELIAVDANAYNYLVNTKIKNYSIRYVDNLPENYSYQYINNTDAFYKLFSAYINTLDNNEMINRGLISFKTASTSGTLISAIANYTLLFIALCIIGGVVVFFTKKRLKLNTKIKKDEKLKFVDLLTSLKNRNYLNEKKNAWNQNTIYPQGVIIIDLNNVKYLNDTFGHTEGDKQITAAANALIKTQLDNSEIIRTDGNEFMIYLVGYSEKQVINYIKKLVREFKQLPYEYGAAFGFSMIVDDLKLIDDAINEATIQMRENKEHLEGKLENENK